MTTIAVPTEQSNAEEEFEVLDGVSAADQLAGAITISAYEPVGKTIAAAIDAIRPGASEEDCANAICLVESLGRLYRFAKSIRDARLIAKINADGELTLGPVRYYVGNKRSEKCRQGKMSEAVQKIMDAAAGDMDAFVGCLSSSALKVGATRKLLSPADFDAVFETTIEQDLKTGKPVKVLKSADERFLK
ncbi:MAG: hypothetical protein JO353_10965 [Phycisphaerae bacterium]|nr:hypothetical protein [Phycisphaerae bacterium]